MKHSTYHAYTPGTTERCEAALLTVWAALGDYARGGNLALVGGLAPRYLCGPARDGAAGETDYAVVTEDVDFGLSLAADGEMYGDLRERLEAQGFAWKERRFVREMPGARLHLDLLVEGGSDRGLGAADFEGLTITAVPGIARALANARVVEVRGRDLLGAEVVETIRVGEVGSFTVLKANAYGGRAAGKDVFDLVRCCQGYDRGLDAAVSAFHAEGAAGNPGHAAARRVLAERFDRPQAKGPTAYADFLLSALRGSVDPEEFTFLYAQRANEAVAVAARLIA